MAITPSGTTTPIPIFAAFDSPELLCGVEVAGCTCFGVLAVRVAGVVGKLRDEFAVVDG